MALVALPFRSHGFDRGSFCGERFAGAGLAIHGLRGQGSCGERCSLTAFLAAGRVGGRRIRILAALPDYRFKHDLDAFRHATSRHAILLPLGCTGILALTKTTGPR